MMNNEKCAEQGCELAASRKGRCANHRRIYRRDQGLEGFNNRPSRGKIGIRDLSMFDGKMSAEDREQIMNRMFPYLVDGVDWRELFMEDRKILGEIIHDRIKADVGRERGKPGKRPALTEEQAAQWLRDHGWDHSFGS